MGQNFINRVVIPESYISIIIYGFIGKINTQIGIYDGKEYIRSS
jgi:hypothetical protein